MKSSVFSYSDDENVNSEDRQTSNRSYNLLSSVSPSKKKLASLSPDKKSRQTSPIKREPLGCKTSNNSSTKTSTLDTGSSNTNGLDNAPSLNLTSSRNTNGLSNARAASNAPSLDNPPALNPSPVLPSTTRGGRKWLRKGITVSNTGSFVNNYSKLSNESFKYGLSSSPLRKSAATKGLVKYKSLVLNDFNISEKHSYEQDDRKSSDDDELQNELKAFWASKGNFDAESEVDEHKINSIGAIFSTDIKEDEPDYKFKESKSYRTLLNSNKRLTLFDEVEFVPNKPAELVDQSVEKHSTLTRDEKRKLNEFKAPFDGIYNNRQEKLIKKEFLLLNNNQNAELNKENLNPYSLQEINLSQLIEEPEKAGNSGAINPGTRAPEHLSPANGLSLDEFDEILRKNHYDCSSIELDL